MPAPVDRYTGPMSEITRCAPLSAADSYALAYQLGVLKGLEATGQLAPTAELREELDAIWIDLLDGRLRGMNPAQALEGFLMGLGSLESQADATVPVVSTESIQSVQSRARVEVIRRAAEAANEARAAVGYWVEHVAVAGGRTYRHSILPRLVADMLGDIFGSRRDPGQVLDEAIASRFDVTENGVKPRDLMRIAVNARQRISASPDLMKSVVEPWIAATIAGDDHFELSSKARLTESLMRLLFLDDLEDDVVCIKMGMYMGGLLGAICLAPFRDRFATDRLVDAWSEEEIQQARTWVMQMVDPLFGVTALGRWGEVKALEPLRQIGWLPSTDFLMQLETLSKGTWFYESDGEDTGLQDFLAERIRVGSMLAIWRSGGRFEVAPREAVGPDLLRDHNFGRGRDWRTRWDLAVSLNALTDDGHAAFRSFESAVPDQKLIMDAIEDALETQHWELAEALTSLRLLYLVIESHLDRPNSLPSDFLAWQREMQPREYGYLGPTVRYLLSLSRTEEFAGHGWAHGLEEACELFVVGGPEAIDPNTITHSAARSELVSRLVGPVFLQLPNDVKSKLVDVVLRRKRLACDIEAGRLRHFGGDTVALVVPLETLLRERFSTLSEKSLDVLRFRGVERSAMTLGPMVMALKKFQEYPAHVQDELRWLFPCLPLSKAQRERLFSLGRLRNEGAHADLDLAKYNNAWDLLFASSFNGAKDNPGIYAILGRQFDGVPPV